MRRERTTVLSWILSPLSVHLAQCGSHSSHKAVKVFARLDHSTGDVLISNVGGFLPSLFISCPRCDRKVGPLALGSFLDTAQQADYIAFIVLSGLS